MADRGILQAFFCKTCNNFPYFSGDAGDQRYRKEAEEVLRELGFTGGETAEEKTGLFSGLKDWLRKEGL